MGGGDYQAKEGGHGFICRTQIYTNLEESLCALVCGTGIGSMDKVRTASRDGSNIVFKQCPPALLVSCGVPICCKLNACVSYL